MPEVEIEPVGAGTRHGGVEDNVGSGLGPAVTGLAVGFGVPWLFHYRHAPPALLGKITDDIRLVPAANGAAVVGTF